MKLIKELLREGVKAINLGKPTSEIAIKIANFTASQSLSPAIVARLRKEYLLPELKRIYDNYPAFAAYIHMQIAVSGAADFWPAVVYNWAVINLGRPDVIAIQLSKDFAENMLSTDYGSTQVGGLKMPFFAPVVLRMPPGYFIMEPGVEWKPLELISLTPVEDAGMHLPFGADYVQGVFVTLHGGVGTSKQLGDDYYATFMCPLVVKKDGTDLPLNIEDISETFKIRTAPSAGAFQDDVGFHEFPIETYLHIIYGTLLYLNLPNPSLARASDRKPISSLLELIPAPARTINVLKRGLDPAKATKARWPTAIITEQVEKLPRTAYRHLVRGHYRHYHVGPGRVETVLRWIKPYIRHKRGPEGTPGTYDIEGLDEAGYYV